MRVWQDQLRELKCMRSNTLRTQLWLRLLYPYNEAVVVPARTAPESVAESFMVRMFTLLKICGTINYFKNSANCYGKATLRSGTAELD